MALELAIPGGPSLELRHLLLDVNGTLTRHGQLLDGVRERLELVRAHLEPLLLTADTFGTLDDVAGRLNVRAEHAPGAEDKLARVDALGPERCVAVGNGANDAAMLAAAALGIAIVGPEGASAAAVQAADLVCGSILAALDLLLEPRALVATLRT